MQDSIVIESDVMDEAARVREVDTSLDSRAFKFSWNAKIYAASHV